MSNTGVVYIIRQNGTDLYKVGFTRRSVNTRLDELQIGSGLSLSVAYQVPTVNPEELERYLHQKLTRRIPGRQGKVHGEWFHLSESWLKTIMFELLVKDGVTNKNLGIGAEELS